MVTLHGCQSTMQDTTHQSTPRTDTVSCSNDRKPPDDEIHVDEPATEEFSGLTRTPQICDDDEVSASTGTNVYRGQFADRFPHLDAPPLPEVIRRFRAKSSPRHGAQRVHYGQTYDRERLVATCTRHGVPTRHDITVGQLVNPRPVSNFIDHLTRHREKIYQSETKKPVGRAPDATKSLPGGLDPNTFTFGVWNERDLSAGQVVNPDVNPLEIDEQRAKSHGLYKLSHNDYFPGEQRSRDYIRPTYNCQQRFGKRTPHDNSGSAARKSLKWLQFTEAEKATPFLPQIQKEFNERTKWPLDEQCRVKRICTQTKVKSAVFGQSIRDTLNVPLSHTFGLPSPWSKYGVADLLHNRAPERYLRGRHHDRSVISLVRNQLKKANFLSFDNLLHAFKFYDKEQKGRINQQDLYETCLQFNIPLSPEQVVQLMDYCDVNNDALIDYVEFANFLNWKDKMPSGFPKPCCPPCDLDLDADARPVRLGKHLDCAATDYRTSASMINATVGQIPTQSLRRYGVPSIRSDLFAPNNRRRCADTRNYRDQADVWSLINRSVFSQHGVFEKDVLAPRTKQQLKEIFANVGVEMDSDTFDKFYELAAQTSPDGLVSVDTFRGVLDNVNDMAMQKRSDVARDQCVGY